MAPLQALSTISNVEFRVANGGSVALCSLAFDTNLRKIDFAQVGLTACSVIIISILIIIVILLIT